MSLSSIRMMEDLRPILSSLSSPRTNTNNNAEQAARCSSVFRALASCGQKGMKGHTDPTRVEEVYASLIRSLECNFRMSSEFRATRDEMLRNVTFDPVRECYMWDCMARSLPMTFGMLGFHADGTLKKG